MGIHTFALVAVLVGIGGLRTGHSAQPAQVPASGSVTLDVLLDRANGLRTRLHRTTLECCRGGALSAEDVCAATRVEIRFPARQFPGASLWQTFRQVLEVDGKSLRRRNDGARLIELFTTPTPDGLKRINQIAREGARH